ncbi:hypothetical protein AMS68_005400 [Peltaster fructicola]|uniref:phosphoinositide 5-phosphatase n=1 Tax=Peltaster fructicola TaxID=286661 RepID=A0A6H0XYP7_9PEZI|nr:hypothetical protein AMS68_005400 [Peltaster fructicola]
MPIRVLLRDSPGRAIALATETHALIFKHSTSSSTTPKHGSTSSVNDGGSPRCIVEFLPWERADMQGFRSLSSAQVYGTLGLVTINGDVFLCIVSSQTRAATVRPGENVLRIQSVEFHCLNKSDYDHLLNDQVNPFPTDGLDADGFDHSGHKEPLIEHPCMALKKLLSGGSFFYSTDFDLTKRLQDRPVEANSVAIDSLDAGFLWNTYMIQPLVDFRSRLSEREREALDRSQILTSAIRGFALTVTVPPSSSPVRATVSGKPSTLTLISRLSCRRAGTRFNARGIDDDGNVANFVESETIFCTDQFCFSYVQCRGSVPLFWEQASGLPGQQKVTITRSIQATQPAFDKHFDALYEAYGDVYIVNLLSEEKPNETQLTRQYENHVAHHSLNEQAKMSSAEHEHVKVVNYDFHAETRGPNGYEAASGIRRYIMEAAIAFEYFLTQDTEERPLLDRRSSLAGQSEVLKQAGVFRTNCLDCLDRTNLVQTIISQIALEVFIRQHDDRLPTSDFWARHGMLWADCGDALSKIYAGTGALKSSFTRSGKMTFAGAMADLRKSAQRLYINNFEDKGRQNTIDMLLGRLIGQMPVHLYDPVNDYVTAELSRRASEFTTPQTIRLWIGTFNLNGKTHGVKEDLSTWLRPNVDTPFERQEIVAVAFQEIVELNAQQILQTDPYRRQEWEESVRQTLNTKGKEEYVLLRGGQLVGASLSLFVKRSALPFVKNVEGAVKKTGMSGMAGNKGAVAIRMDYADTSICLVTAHLAAGFANYEERNQDYRTISSGLRFQRNRSIEDHDAIIWFGDFNYRIGMSNERARQLIDAGDLATLYENDQLNLQMTHGKTFPHYSEKTPTFLPTYKFNLNTDEYDTSEKSRIPAWCDRILSKGKCLRQVYYDSSPLRFSDHRPVWGIFQCKVNVVEQAKKDAISNEVYARRTATVGQPATDGISDDESLFGYESVEPGLPPASSDKRKWWLDNGMPARSTVNAPVGSVLNPSRASNPWSSSSEPDWVDVRDDVSIEPARSEKLFVAATVPDVVEEAKRIQLKSTLRKAPAKPHKPTLLRADSNQSNASLPGSRNVSGQSVPPPPAPRRAGRPVDESGPALPPRRSEHALLDTDDGGSLTEWQPLKPT